jgi:OOP family OmpA-OmpF porin
MKTAIVALSLALAAPAYAQFDSIMKSDAAKKAMQQGENAAAAKANETVAKKVNAKLLSESRKNQCSFKSDSDELEKGCEKKAKNLANALVSAKNTLDHAGVRNYKFVVNGHTDTSGNAQHNMELSRKRAEAIVKQLVAQGVKADQIEAVGKGATEPLIKNDKTAAQKAKNRRYELQVKF